MRTPSTPQLNPFTSRSLAASLGVLLTIGLVAAPAQAVEWNPLHWFHHTPKQAAPQNADTKQAAEPDAARPDEPESKPEHVKKPCFFKRHHCHCPWGRKHDKKASDAVSLEPSPVQVPPVQMNIQPDATTLAQKGVDLPQDPASPEALQDKVVLVETEKGNIAFSLYPKEAPVTVHNFVALVNEGFYNKYNMKFHRVEPGFVIQTGDPTGTGAGGAKKTIPLEIKNHLSHNSKGVVAMARSFDPDSASSQFYITLAPEPFLDGKYAIFGKVVSGLSVLDKIQIGDMMYGVHIVDKSTITPDPIEKKHFLGL